jgi:hypothetical protein
MNLLTMLFWLGLGVAVCAVMAWKRYSEKGGSQAVPMALTLVAGVMIALPAFVQKRTVLTFEPPAQAPVSASVER